MKSIFKISYLDTIHITIVFGQRLVTVQVNVYHIYRQCVLTTSQSDGTVAKPSANGLVDTVFASWYQLQPRASF